MPTIKTRPFNLGRLLTTPGVLTSGIDQPVLLSALTRHARCDWGEMDPEDWGQNGETMNTKGANYGRLFSAYTLPTIDGRTCRIYIITDNPFNLSEFVERPETTVMLPEDY